MQMNVDVHAHIVDRKYLQDLISTLGLETELTSDGKSLLRRDGCTIAWSRPDMFEIDQRLSEMDKKDITVRILSLSTPNVYLWDDANQVAAARQVNNALAALCNQHPDRFIGLASLPLKDVKSSLVELNRCVHELGMKGVVIGSNIDGLQLDNPKLDPIWARIDELRLPVFEHPMFPKNSAGFEEFELPLRLGLIFDTTLAATRLIYSGIFERYPNFPYIMAHTGGALLMALERLDNGYRLFPDCRRFIAKLPSEYAKRLYYDTTAFDQKALSFAIDTVGPNQLLFGTDDPFIDADTTHVANLPVSPRDKQQILGANAARIFGL
jgi:aminocarboxymuconate-semialdehyde decarboxylase